MELTTIKATSGKVSVQIPEEWLRRSLLEGDKKLLALIEMVKEIERFDFKHIQYPELLKKRLSEARAKWSALPKQQEHIHILASITKKMREKGVVPYCLSCDYKENSTL